MLQIYDSRERLLVRVADAALGLLSNIPRAFGGRPGGTEPTRILLLRLERIGDLVMVLEAIQDARALAPAAEIDLVVGSWNAPLARAIPHLTRVETVDARWLARDGDGLGLGALLRVAGTWRSRRYDLAINFEPDIRSNLMLAVSGAARTAGWASGGGGPVLDVALDYDPRSHTSDNARRLVAAVFGRKAAESARSLLTIPEPAMLAAAARLRPALGRPLVGVHVSGGRAIKQWDPDRFAEVAARLADVRGAAIVATGGPGDRELVERFTMSLAPRLVIDSVGYARGNAGVRPDGDTDGDDLLISAALLAQLDLLVTGDTGPMHLASAVGTPVVAVFGPSDPVRYASTGRFDRIVRVDLPCSPCNRIRRPPARCLGHTPDCLTHVSADAVFAAAVAVLDASSTRMSGVGRS